MTETDWLTATDPTPMLGFLRGKTSGRKSRLLICALCRQGIDNIRAARFLNGLEVAERYADGTASDDDRQAAYQGTTFRRRANWPQLNFQAMVHNALAPDESLAPMNALHRVANPRAKAFRTAMLRCLFGNPFRPVAVDPGWLTSDVVALADGVYAERAFDRLPILADALQDAGCGNEDVLTHCRSEGPHVRGCWVVDLLLGKT